MRCMYSRCPTSSSADFSSDITGGAQRLPLAVPLPRAFLLYLLCLLNLLCLRGNSPYCAGIITRT